MAETHLLSAAIDDADGSAPDPYVDRSELEAGVDLIRQSHKDIGRLDLIVRRPAVEVREVVDEAQLDLQLGMVGDNWRDRGSSSTEDGRSHPGKQITLMNSRAAALVARSPDRWPLAGDQLYVDLDLSADNLPPGTLLRIGTSTIEVTEFPHRGCAKFSARFGREAMRFVNSPVGRELNLRGVNARVLEAGTIRSGDRIYKQAAPQAARPTAAEPSRSLKLSQ